MTPVNPLADARWDDRLRARFGTVSFFHGAAWARVLVETYGFRPAYFVADDDRAVLPVMEVDSWLTGKRGVGLPFTDECPPLGADIDKLLSAAREYGAARGWKYLECRGSAAGERASTEFYAHRIALQPDTENLERRCDSATRRAIRKARQAGVQVVFGVSDEMIAEFYRLLCQTRRRHGLPPQPLRFFRKFQEHALQAGHGTVALARHAGRWIAGAVYVWSGDRAIYKYGASDEREQNLRPNNLVMWEAICHLAQRGCRELHLGRTSLFHDGLRRFKLGWGATEETLAYTRYDYRAQQVVPVPDRVAGWHNQVFHCLPGPLARLAGAVLYKHVA